MLAISEEQSPGNKCAIKDQFSKLCIVPLVSADDKTLAFSDAPADVCLPGGSATEQDFYCNGVSDPPGSVLAFTTSLVGIYQDGTSSQSLFDWTWTDTYNGTSGGSRLPLMICWSIPVAGPAA